MAFLLLNRAVGYFIEQITNRVHQALSIVKCNFIMAVAALELPCLLMGVATVASSASQLRSFPSKLVRLSLAVNVL